MPKLRSTKAGSLDFDAFGKALLNRTKDKLRASGSIADKRTRRIDNRLGRGEAVENAGGGGRKRKNRTNQKIRGKS